MSPDGPTQDLPTASLMQPRTFADAPPPPPEIEHYRLEGLLGEGGFGSVYLAEQTHPVRRPVALKVVKAGMDSRYVLARFEAERQALALMDHPGVAKVFGAGTTREGRPYFAMEHVRGEPINHHCERAALGVEDRVRLMARVCEAVQHAHQKGVIHRDLKPGNILVETLDGRSQPKVIDFGVAKALHAPLTDAPLDTVQGQVIGTPEYMSPEQARGAAHDVDTRADVYSLGAILYELLTGVVPLDSRSVREGGYAGLGESIGNSRVTRPSERVAPRSGRGSRGGGGGSRGSGQSAPRSAAPDDAASLAKRLRGDLDWIVMKCLEADRERRYSAASELGADLERFLRHEPVVAGPPGVGYRATKFIRRNRVAVAAGAVVTLALVAGTVGTSLGLAWALRAAAEANKALDAAIGAAKASQASRDESDKVTTFLSDMLGSVAPAPGEGGRDVSVGRILDEASDTVGAAFGDTPVLEARLRQTLGDAYRALGRLEDAEKHLPRAYQIREAELGPEDPATLRALTNLASLRFDQGRFAEAEEMARRALDGWERIGGENGRGALGVVNNLAQFLLSQGKLDEAEPMQRRALAGFGATLGPDHPHTLGAMVNLGTLHLARGEPEKALSLLEDADRRWRGLTPPPNAGPGADHPGALSARHVLGNAYLATKQPDKAEATFRALIDDRTRVLGPDHPDTIGAIANLGVALNRQKKFEEAEGAYTQAWEGACRAMGEGHADARTMAGNLLQLYEKQGWPARTREIAARVLATYAAAADSPDATPGTLNDYAWTLLTVPEELRDTAAALRLSRRAVERARAIGDPGLWQYLDTLGLALSRSGDGAELQEAARVQREAVGLIPTDAEEYRAEMEERLREYEARGPD